MTRLWRIQIVEMPSRCSLGMLKKWKWGHQQHSVEVSRELWRCSSHKRHHRFTQKWITTLNNTWTQSSTEHCIIYWFSSCSGVYRPLILFVTSRFVHTLTIPSQQDVGWPSCNLVYSTLWEGARLRLARYFVLCRGWLLWGAGKKSTQQQSLIKNISTKKCKNKNRRFMRRIDHQGTRTPNLSLTASQQ